MLTQHSKLVFLFPVQQQALAGQDLLTVEASRSHSDTPHSVGLLWTSDQPHSKTSTWLNTTLTMDKTSMHRSGIRTRNPRKQVTVDPRLSPRGHWDMQITGINILYTYALGFTDQEQLLLSDMYQWVRPLFWCEDGNSFSFRTVAFLLEY